MLDRNPVVITGTVTTEGDELYYEVRGQGLPLLMIPGGGGDGRIYNMVAGILANEYKVITYDRRANGRSSKNEPQNFEVSQQSRDAVAVLRAAGEPSAFVFGCSSGAVIALDMAKNHPDSILAVIVHEPPAVRVLPDSEKWLRYFAGLHHMAYRFGTGITMIRFSIMLGLHLIFSMIKAARKSTSPANLPASAEPKSDDEFFLKQELLPVVRYLPDVRQIRQNKVNVFMAIGKWTLDNNRVYGRTVPILANMLDCEMVILPGHHVSYVDMPDEWAASLRDVLHKAESSVPVMQP